MRERIGLGQVDHDILEDGNNLEKENRHKNRNLFIKQEKKIGNSLKKVLSRERIQAQAQKRKWEEKVKKMKVLGYMFFF